MVELFLVMKDEGKEIVSRKVRSPLLEIPSRVSRDMLISDVVRGHVVARHPDWDDSAIFHEMDILSDVVRCIARELPALSDDVRSSGVFRN